jgi:hypothetical protein
METWGFYLLRKYVTVAVTFLLTSVSATVTVLLTSNGLGPARRGKTRWDHTRRAFHFRTSRAANQLYFVADYDDASLSHVWRGLRVKRSKTIDGYTVIGKREEMVRKAGSRSVEV